MDLPLKIGLNIVSPEPALVLEFARAAEELGYESLWSGEHVALPQRNSWWSGFPGGDAVTEEMVPFHPDSPFLDPMVVLAHVATATSRVRLGIGIYMLTLRDAVLAGRTIASLDVLSGGRLDVASGLGWTEDEYRITGNDWQVRRRRCNELIRALRVLFDEERPEFHGEFFDFDRIGLQLKPLQQPFPIHIGGGGLSEMRRPATLGNGWYGYPQAVPEIERLRVECGRSDEPFEFSTITVQGPKPMEVLEALAAMGVQRVVVTPWAGTKVGEVGRAGLDDIERYAWAIGLV